MNALFIVLAIVSYLLCGIYLSGRYGFSFDSNDDDDVWGAFTCPLLWPFFLLWRFIHAVWVRGFKRRFDD